MLNKAKEIIKDYKDYHKYKRFDDDTDMLGNSRKSYLTSTERLVLFGPLVLVILVVFIFFKCENTSHKDFKLFVVPSEFHGIVKEKYLHPNHAEARVKLTLDGIIKEYVIEDWIGLYEKIEVGDSLFKNKGDTIIQLKKWDENIYKFNYFYGSGMTLTRRKWNDK